jgi:hypothetical protein
MTLKTFARTLLLLAFAAGLASYEFIVPRAKAQSAPRREESIRIPKAWNDHDLSDWATPLRGLGLPPTFLSESEFEKIPVARLYRAYPVYHPDHEPPGYWDWLQKQTPKPLLESANLHTEADWVAAGRIVFHELSGPVTRQNADLIPLVRSREALARAGIKTLPDGTLSLLWVVTPEGVIPAQGNCQGCHTRYLPEGTTIDGAAANHQGTVLLRLSAPPEGRLAAAFAGMDIETLRAEAYRRMSVPWLVDDPYNAVKSMTREDIVELASIDERSDNQIHPRGGGGLFPTKTLDLNGVRDRKYLNHTATHLNRGVGDIMRYTLNITCCGSRAYGSYRVTPENVAPTRYPDDILFALATYVYSLDPPPSPYRNDPLASDGAKIFERERCGVCHTPPLYTNNKLTLAKGFTPPPDHPYKNDIMPLSVGTDPGRAMQSRVGTGFYRVPSLRGVWYRNFFGHGADVTSLEDWFDPARLRADYVPSGWKGFKQTHRAVTGHEFGLRLPAAEKRALIAFLKTL